MEEPQLLTDPNPNPNPNPNLSTAFDSLPLPPLDFPFGPNPSSNPDLNLDLDNLDFDFDFDDLYLPSESEDLLSPSHFLVPDPNPAIRALDNAFPDSDPARVSNSPEISTDHSSSSARVLNSPSQESNSRYADEFSGPTSSQGSGSGLDVTNSGNCDVDVVDQKIKVEESGKNLLSKRKKDTNEEATNDSRTSKFRRSSISVPVESAFNAGTEEEEKRKSRLMRNRESAQLSRQRKKHYVEELEDKVRAMHSTITDLNTKISFVMAENATLRQQLSGNGGAMMYPHHPMAPMGYPWMPCAPYVVKPQGSQVPLVPIPRLKPQQPMSAPKAKKAESKKTEGNKRAEGKTKKVASVSFLGLLFFVLLFGGLVPMVNVRFAGVGDDYVVSNRFEGEKHSGRVFSVNGNLNGTDLKTGVGFFDGKANRVRGERGYVGEELNVEQRKGGSRGLSGLDEFGHSGNSSEPLVASLYVPRNDKLVKIDGNLIIHSVLASEKAMASHAGATPGKKNGEETGLAIAGNLASALAISEGGNSKGRGHYYRNAEPQRALTSGSADGFKDNVKSTHTDGKLQQWFREGLAGPMLSSGMCTEVFQFDVSPASTPGAIVPASPVTNNTRDHRQNSTSVNKGKNRRILHGLPISLNRYNLNITEEHVGRNSQNDDFEGNKSLSSMVVSVLVDPREAGDGDADGVIGPKALSRIFVVVLLDSVKYVTYSCVLPLKGLVHI